MSLAPQTIIARTKGPQELPLSFTLSWKRLCLSLGKIPKAILEESENRIWSFLLRNHKESISAIRDSYNTERLAGRLPHIRHIGEVVSYLLGFHLPNAARLFFTWQRMMARNPNLLERLKEFETITLYDLGCGSGAMSHAMVYLLRSHGIEDSKIRVKLFDRSQHFLNCAEEALEQIEFKGKVIKVKNLEIKRDPASNKNLQIFSLGYFWNETVKNPKLREKLMRIFSSVEKTPTMILLLEPAHEAVAREMMNFRDQLVVESGFASLYPCPQVSSCPMVLSRRDYCYSEFPWVPPRDQNQVDGLTGIKNRTILASSSYVFSNFIQNKTTQPIVVGRPTLKDAPGRFEYLLCQPEKGLEKKAPKHPNQLRSSRGEVFS